MSEPRIEVWSVGPVRLTYGGVDLGEAVPGVRPLVGLVKMDTGAGGVTVHVIRVGHANPAKNGKAGGGDP